MIIQITETIGTCPPEEIRTQIYGKFNNDKNKQNITVEPLFTTTRRH
jgi:hypothetical protein